MSLQKPTTADFLLLHFIVVLWGFTALLGVFMAGLTPTEVVFWRTLLASVAMWALFGRRYLRVPLRTGQFWPVMGAGALIAVHWFLFFLAARVGNVSSCLAGLACNSVIVALLEPLVERRRIRLADLGSSVLVLAGLLIIFAGQADKVWGVVIGIASALFTGLYGLANRHFMKQGEDVYAVSTVGLTGAFATTLFLLPISQALGIQPTLLPKLPAGQEWLWLLILVGAATVFALTVSVSLLRRFSAFATSLAINLEPVYGILLARLLLGKAEAMTPAFYLGTALILLAVAGHPWLQRYVVQPVRP